MFTCRAVYLHRRPAVRSGISASQDALTTYFGDVEVVSHHGSGFSSNTTYVTTLSARATVISVGKNSFGNPDPAVVAGWDAQGDAYQTQTGRACCRGPAEAVGWLNGSEVSQMAAFLHRALG